MEPGSWVISTIAVCYLPWPHGLRTIWWLPWCSITMNRPMQNGHVLLVTTSQGQRSWKWMDIKKDTHRAQPFSTVANQRWSPCTKLRKAFEDWGKNVVCLFLVGNVLYHRNVFDCYLLQSKLWWIIILLPDEKSYVDWFCSYNFSVTHEGNRSFCSFPFLTLSMLACLFLFVDSCGATYFWTFRQERRNFSHYLLWPRTGKMDICLRGRGLVWLVSISHDRMRPFCYHKQQWSSISKKGELLGIQLGACHNPLLCQTQSVV